jgi:hypothetical protein
MTNQTKEKEFITLKQLADRANVKPPALRRILRSKFPRKDKGQNYRWEPNDPQIELILKAVKDSKAEKPKLRAVPKPKAKRTKSEKGVA